jgi:hypothetical protein
LSGTNARGHIAEEGRFLENKVFQAIADGWISSIAGFLIMPSILAKISRVIYGRWTDPSIDRAFTENALKPTKPHCSYEKPDTYGSGIFCKLLWNKGGSEGFR